MDNKDLLDIQIGTFYKDIININFSESLLIIPTVSIGNVPQLTVDLLIHTYEFIKVGILNDFYLFPFVGPQDGIELKEEGSSNGLEVYYNNNLKIVILHQRSPVIVGFMEKFVKNVIYKFIKKFNISKVILLDSQNASFKEPKFYRTTRIHSKDTFLKLNLNQLKIDKEKDICPKDEKEEFSMLLNQLYDVSDNCTLFDLKLLNIVVFEGENFSDAEILCEKLLSFLCIEKKQWVRPLSWINANKINLSESYNEGIYI